ncbi:MAG TPA: hypothetical protein VHF89_11395 [Solirubrobacteraceae bacterium]|nr:hypothetical protein [Solirubrobacteraceae bacterium]
MPTRPLLVAALVLVVTAFAAAPAFGAGPPRGKYGCIIGDNAIFAGNLFILANNRYRVDDSKVGRYRNRPGRKMRFRSGAYKGLYRGYWHRTDGGGVEIELTSIESGRTLTYCTLEKRA